MDHEHSKEGQEIQQKRERNQQQLRKQKRNELFKKKRNIDNINIDTDNINLYINQSQNEQQVYNPQEHLENHQFKTQIIELLNKEYKRQDLLQLLTNLQNQDILVKHDAVIGIRKILSNEDDCPIQEFIDSNGIPLLLKTMQDDSQAHLQLEAAWAMTNVVCGTTQQTLRVVQNDGINYFVKLLHHRYLRVAEQAIWALGNIAGDNHLFRDQILQSNAIVPIRNLIHHPMATSNTVQQGIWTLSNLCRGNPIPDYQYTKEAVEVFCHTIKKVKNLETLSNAAWALCYLSDGDNSRIDKIIATGVVPFLIQYLCSPMISLQIPCLRIMGNLTTGTDQQTDYCLNSGLLAQLFNMLETDNPAIQREILWTIANICCGQTHQIKLVIQNKQYMDFIIKLLNDTNVSEVQEEILYLFQNVLIKGGQQEIEVIYEIQLIKYINQILSDHNQLHRVLELALNILNKLFTFGKNIFHQNNQNLFILQFQQNNGNQVLEELQSHPSDELYQLASNLIQQFFDIEEEDQQY